MRRRTLHIRRYPYSGHCAGCGSDLMVMASKLVSASKLLAALTLEHRRVSPECHHGTVELPYLSTGMGSETRRSFTVPRAELVQ